MTFVQRFRRSLYRGTAYIVSTRGEDKPEPRRIGFQADRDADNEPRPIGFRMERRSVARCPTCNQPRHGRFLSNDSTGVERG